MSRTRSFTFAALVALATGCGSTLPPFSPSTPDNRSEALAPVLARLAAAPVTAPESILVGVTKAPSELVALSLPDGRVRFRIPVESRTAPFLAGSVTVVETAEAILGLALADGHEAFRIPTDGGATRLVAAAGEGSLVAVVLSTGAATSRVVVLRDGRVALTREVPQPAGVPAVRADLVFVPWGYQNLTVLDANSGDELARVRTTDGMLGYAFAIERDVYFGQTVLHRLDARSVEGTDARTSTYTPPSLELENAPPFLADAYRPPAPTTSAAHHVGFAYRPRSGDPLGLAGDVLHLVFYRAVFGLSAHDAAPRWARVMPTDIVGREASSDELVLVDDKGVVTSLRATDGAPRFRLDTTIPLEAATIRLGGALPANLPEDPVPSLDDQLYAVASNPDNRLLPARRLAVRKLGALDSEEATADLVALCDDARVPRDLRTVACDSMTRRPNGSDAVVDALARHTLFLEGTSAGPVGALAMAAGTMHDARAVPLLVAHLRDPSTPLDALEPICRVLGELGDASAAPALRDLIATYHADFEDYEMSRVMRAAAESYARLAGAEAVPFLETIGADALGDRGTATFARELAARLRQELGDAVPAATPAASPPTEPAPAPAPPARTRSRSSRTRADASATSSARAHAAR